MVPPPTREAGRLRDQQSRTPLGGFSAEQILALGKTRANERALEIQENKTKIAASKKRTLEALAVANSERLEKEAERMAKEAALAELAALKKSLGLM